VGEAREHLRHGYIGSRGWRDDAIAGGCDEGWWRWPQRCWRRHRSGAATARRARR